jgi:mono/diheme cytochrome c family protein
MEKRIFCLVAAFMFAFPVLAQSNKTPTLYSKECAACHGVDGRGKTAFGKKAEIPDFHSAKVKQMTDTALFDSIARGTTHRAYPHAYEFRGVKPAEIQEVVKYIRTLQAEGK